MVAPSSLVGSIGCVLSVLDASAFLESIGLKVTTFASGKYKAAGNSNTPMTDDHKEYLQGLVTKSADAFKGFVSRFRNIKPESMEGQVFTAPDAVKAGLADEIVPNLNAAIARMTSGAVQTKAARRNTSAGGFRSQSQGDSIAKAEAITDRLIASGRVKISSREANRGYSMEDYKAGKIK
jgi:ClpP class serine protease